MEVGLSATAHHAGRHRAAVACMLAAMLAMATVDALGKWLVGTYPVSQILAIRSWVMIAVLLIGLSMMGGWRSLRTGRLPGHALRLVAGFGGPCCVFLALRELSLADVTIVVFGAPLLVTVLSAPLFGEKVGAASWCCVGLGFLGILLALQPGLGAGSVGVAFALLACVCYAGLNLSGRWLSGTEPTYRIVFYSSAGTALISTALLALQPWKAMPVGDIGLMAAMGLAASLGHLLMTQAFNTAPLATVAPLEYSTFVWATGFGYMVWGEVPSIPALLGAALIVASSLYMILLET